MEDKELLAELQAGLKEQGVEATEEDIQAAIDKLEAGELSEDNLEDVAGGSLITVPIGPTIGILKLIAICPKCHMPYIRKIGHVCLKRKPKGFDGR